MTHPAAQAEGEQGKAIDTQQSQSGHQVHGGGSDPEPTQQWPAEHSVRLKPLEHGLPQPPQLNVSENTSVQTPSQTWSERTGPARKHPAQSAMHTPFSPHAPAVRPAQAEQSATHASVVGQK